MLGSFLIFLREGIEGSMICAVLLTYLAAGNRRDLFRWVFIGAGVALVGSTVVGTGTYVVAQRAFVGSRAQTIFETFSFGLAVAVLTYMTFWMKRHARKLSKDLRNQVDNALVASSGLALAAVALVTVGRESVETMIFLLAIAFQSSPFQLLVGAAAGLALSLGISFGIYRAGLKLNLARFFTVVGAALMVVAAGLLANTIQNLQQLGVLPGAGHAIWNTSWILPDDGRPGLLGTVGDILHGLLGYAASPTVLQAAAWICFLTIGLYAFLRPVRPSKPAIA